jgi:hypothetical protein
LRLSPSGGKVSMATAAVIEAVIGLLAGPTNIEAHSRR